MFNNFIFLLVNLPKIFDCFVIYFLLFNSKLTFYKSISFTDFYLSNIFAMIHMHCEVPVWIKRGSVNLSFIYYKFKLLGFIHFKAIRAIGSVHYLNLADSEIVYNFSYIYMILRFWFLGCYNYEKLLILLKLLKESCILTLCRKHNKSKSWVKSIYTSNILVSKTLYDSFPYFMSSNLNFTKYIFFIDESFFFN